MHCILESTFARIFLFLELPFLQEAQFYRENLSQSSSLEEFPDLPAITVTFSRGHFMWGKHAALLWLGILSSLRESSHLQCSKNKKIRAKVDSEGLYGRGRLLFMCSWLCKIVSLGQKLKWPKTCEKQFYKHVGVVLCNEPLEKTPNIREMRRFWKSAILQRLYTLQNCQFGSKIKMAKNMRKTILQAR